MNNMYQNTVNKPFFSIGITTYNRKDLLRQMLLSLLKQDFTDFEIIVGNDFIAEPLTSEMLGIDDNRIIILNNNQNLGELGNMNSLLRMAKGRYFTWQFDDDLCAPTFLSEIKKALEKYDFPSCVFTSFTYIYGTSTLEFPKIDSKEMLLYSGRDFLRSYLSGSIRVLGLGGFYNTEYLKSLGGAMQLSEGKMALYSEYLLIFKAGLLNHVAYLNSQMVANRVHDNSWSSKSTEVEIFKQAGINLIRESILIFSTTELKDDFSKNLTSLLKSVLSVVITKSKTAGIKVKKKDISEYISLIEEVFNSLKEKGLHKSSMKSLKISINYIPLFYVKAWLKILLSNRYLKFVHKVVFIISRYTNKSF